MNVWRQGCGGFPSAGYNAPENGGGVVVSAAARRAAPV